MRNRSLIAAAMSLVLLTGCSNMGSIGNILGSVLGGMGGQQNRQQSMDVEVQQVDASRGLLYVRTQDGQQGTIRVDNNTQVIYNNQRYSVTSLRQGDVVRVQTQQTQNNELYASRIDVLRQR
ncbi:MAG TPA: hypothetical protein VMY38_01800 [Gemmatimonadaceae bacterium]|nr:hypothetical protein [Gemmatimonadaceae bacterium]